MNKLLFYSFIMEYIYSYSVNGIKYGLIVAGEYCDKIIYETDGIYCTPKYKIIFMTNMKQIILKVSENEIPIGSTIEINGLLFNKTYDSIKYDGRKIGYFNETETIISVAQRAKYLFENNIDNSIDNIVERFRVL